MTIYWGYMVEVVATQYAFDITKYDFNPQSSCKKDFDFIQEYLIQALKLNPIKREKYLPEDSDKHYTNFNDEIPDLDFLNANKEKFFKLFYYYKGLKLL